MTKLRELEHRLRDEPDNLGLRVVVAGALHEAGRRADAVELYRSVAIAYRDQGRPQQAITVCRSILELAPDDAACQELLGQLVASQTAPRASPPPPLRPSPSLLPLRPSPSPLPRPSVPEVDAADRAEAPARRSSGEMTPLPVPLAHHEAEPSTGILRQLTPADLPPSLRQELSGYPEIAGIAAAARQISASLIAAGQAQATQELELEDLVTADRTTDSTVDRTVDRATDSTTDHTTDSTTDHTTDDDADDDEPTFPPPDGVPRDSASDDEKTEPRDMPIRARAPRPRGALPLAAPAEPPRPPPALASVRSIAPQTTATGPLAGAFFAPLPPRNRAAVLQRFRRRIIAPGTPVIQRGEIGHGLVVVVRGRLDVRLAHAAAGSPRALAAIGPGEFIGEVSLLARAPAAADVVAGAGAEILVLAADDFYDVISSFPALRSELEAVAARRVREHDRPGA